MKDLFESIGDTLNGIAKALDPMAFALSEAAKSAQGLLDVLSNRGADGKIKQINERVEELGDESETLEFRMRQLQIAMDALIQILYAL